MDDLLTVHQVAIILKVHPLTVRRYLNSGKLKAIRAAGNVRVSQHELNRFVEQYIPQSRTIKANKETIATPFSANDPFFRLKGRGLSLERL